MNSKELIQGSKEAFDVLSIEKSFEEDTIEYLKTLQSLGIITIKDQNLLQEKLSTFYQITSNLHWKSFYHGWLEGRLKLVLDEREK